MNKHQRSNKYLFPLSRAQLGRLSEIPDEQLSPDFQNEMRTFLEYIHEIPVPTFYDMQFKGLGWYKMYSIHLTNNVPYAHKLSYDKCNLRPHGERSMRADLTDLTGKN